MKKLFTIVLFLAFSGLGQQTLQAQTEVINQFAELIKSGSVAQLQGNLHTEVEVEINGDQKTVSPAESINIISNFLDKHPVVKFEFIHKGDAGANGYAIGTYTHSSGSFRITLKTQGDRIEKINIKKQ